MLGFRLVHGPLNTHMGVFNSTNITSLLYIIYNNAVILSFIVRQSVYCPTVACQTMSVVAKNQTNNFSADEEFICYNARHDLGDGIPGSLQFRFRLRSTGLV
jgi:hypothetical protein